MVGRTAKTGLGEETNKVSKGQRERGREGEREREEERERE